VYQPTDPAALNFTMEVSAGLALHAARTLRLDIHPMALWDGQRGHIAGGTDCFVALWQHLGYEPTILEPPRPALQPVDGVPAPPALAGAGRSSPDRCERDTLRQEVKTLLFADIVGYSKLNETAIPQFVGIFLEAVSALTASSPWAPRYVNTWGDAICAVFDYAQHAGCYAMELIQLIRDRKEDWIEQGLCSTHTLADGTIEKHPLDIRVGLHTGPVFLHYNPMVRQLAFTGAHVNRAARIEPVTPPGEVFASEEFAALVELDRTRQKHRATPAAGTHDGQALSFLCEYAGSLSLAKGYPGRHRLYRVAPHRVFALEELAKAIHEDYCAAEARKGKTARESPSMEPWAALPEMLRDSNRAQAADIPHKLEALGYELAPSFGLSPAEIVISDEQAAELSAEEHERWMQEKRRGGWTYGPVRDNERKLHPSMIPWEELCEEEKDKDRAAVRNVPRLVEKAGFRLSKINRPG
jgi:class 3 adenylate cyclase